MAQGLHHDSSTDITASSSEDEGCNKRKKRRMTKRSTTINIGGRDNNVAVGSGAKVASITTAATTGNSFDAAEKLKNPNELLKEVTKCRGPEKDKIEKNVLRYLLPYVEEHAIKAASSCNDALELLARFCSPELKSPRLTIHSLKTMKRLLDLEFANCESANAHIIEVERILRRPFVDGSFAKEPQYNQRRRVEVYNSVLALVLLYLAKGHLKHPYINKTDKEEIREFVTKNIKKSLQRNPRPKKDRWRFSMETVLNLIERLFDYKKLSQMTKLLDLWKDINLEAFLEKLQCTESSSVDRFVILKMLHGKLCNNDGDAYRIVEHIIMNHDVFSKQWQHRNEDWQFALLACQILLQTINSSKLSKALRTQAAHCLANLVSTKVYKKSEVIRNIIEKHCIKSSFARDLESRKIVIERLFNKELVDQVLLEGNVLINRICKIHESKGLEYLEPIYKDEDRLIVRGLYDYQPVAITVPIINPIKKLYSAQHQDLSPPEKHLQNEYEILQHLNQTSNKHVLMVHTADTKTRPFHMICEYMAKKDLLHFLRVCKEEQELPTYRKLLEICLQIANSMIFIHREKVIHKQLRPEHVLLDDNFNVRITGFCEAKVVCEDQVKHGIEGERLDLEDPSIRFAAPECLEDPPLFSPGSDVWAFGVLMYVVFTCGGTPYANEDTKDIHQHVLSGRTLTKEQFMRDEIFSLIQKCMGKTRKDRISFQKISEELEKLLADCSGKDADERLRIPVPVQDEDAHDNITMEEEYTSSVSNTTEVSAPPLKKMKGQRTASTKQPLVDYSKGHLEKLRSLDHPHLARIIKDQKTKFGRQVTFEKCDGPSLRNYILNNNCAPENVVRFAAQISDALNYLHSKNIVLCVLNAESVKVFHNDHVKIFGLHYSRSILPTCDELNTSSGVVSGEVDPDIYRWCAKEVIQEGLFSQAGDIWSLGMTILEMFLCLTKDADAIPFSQYSNDEILGVLKKNSRPSQPAQCPDWVYVLVTQCWCLHSSERASSLAVLDCLTQRCPWESYVLQRWLEKNEIHENWPDLNVVQQLNETKKISRQDVESSVSDEFRDYHSYEYDRPSWSVKKVFKSLLTFSRSPRPTRSALPTASHVLSNASSVPSLPLLQPSTHLASPSAMLSISCDYDYIPGPETPTDVKQKEENEEDDDDNDDTYDRPIPVNEVACPPRSRLLSLPSRPFPPNPSKEPSSNTKQTKEKRQNDDMYDDIYERSRLPANEIACFPRSRSLSLPLRPLPPNPSKENTKEMKEKGQNDDMYDDIYARSRLPANEMACSPRSSSVSPQPSPIPLTSSQYAPINFDFKPKEEKGEDADMDEIEDTYHVRPTGVIHVDPDQEHNAPDQEPQINLSDESYQELWHTTEDGYMPLVRDNKDANSAISKPVFCLNL